MSDEDEKVPERRTVLVVDVTWNGADTGRGSLEHYYDDAELPSVAGGWITDAFYDRDDGPAPTVSALSPAELAMLRFALREAYDITLTRDGFTDEETAALDSLRARFGEGP
jgi:hypothetical protein